MEAQSSSSESDGDSNDYLGKEIILLGPNAKIPKCSFNDRRLVSRRLNRREGRRRGIQQAARVIQSPAILSRTATATDVIETNGPQCNTIIGCKLSFCIQT